MMTTARSSIAAVIKRLAADQSKLEKILVKLNAVGSPISESGARNSPSKRRYMRRAKPTGDDRIVAIDLIKTARKGGIKALNLSHELRRVGHRKVSKVDLLADENIKLVGKGGGSTYVHRE